MYELGGVWFLDVPLFVARTLRGFALFDIHFIVVLTGV